MFPVLNLPPIQPRLQESNGKVWIFDVIRKKFVVLTPEEWVRQHFVHFLLIRQYPKSLLKIESGLTFNSLHKRSDVVVFNRQGQPWMVVECKNPHVVIDESTASQAAVYNAALRAHYIAITNGLNHLYYRTDWNNNKVVPVSELPGFE
jgi:hypothetical protein